jgi:hypothetical protein
VLSVQAEAVFKAVASTPEAVTEEIVQINYAVENGSLSNFVLPDLTPFEVVSGPARTQNYQVINGKVSRSVSISYGIRSSKLWINPASEDSDSITGTDGAFPFEVFTYAFREAGGIGDIVIDDVKVGTAFTDVAEARYAIEISAAGNDVQISWPVAATTAGYGLEFTADINSTGWMPFTGEISVQDERNVVRFFDVTGNQFFRLAR